MEITLGAGDPSSSKRSLVMPDRPSPLLRITIKSTLFLSMSDPFGPSQTLTHRVFLLALLGPPRTLISPQPLSRLRVEKGPPPSR